MLRSLRAALLLLLVAAAFPAAAAEPSFPALTARVVDEAALLSPAAEQRLTALLERHEKETSNQVVVVTVASLQGYEIADYGYRLGRRWGIGQKERDNGLLLIVAPNERAVRIEVGYGLEHVMTDALGSTIVQTAILPSFRAGNMEAGIEAGVSAILAALQGTYEPLPQGGRSAKGADWASLVPMLIFFAFMVIAMRRMRGRRGIGPLILGGLGGLSGFGGRSSGGGFRSGGGGFRGGGGSFGGGGASGRW